MTYIRLTEKERQSVKREWYERIELELGPEPSLDDAAVLIPNVELARKRSDIHQRGATRTAILAERLQANGAWVLLVVGSLIEAERVYTGSRTLEQSVLASIGLAIFFVLANVVHPIYSLRQHRGQGYTEVRRQTLAGMFEHVWFWLRKPPVIERRDLNYNPALDWRRRVWVWTAQDALSKAWLAWQVGKRTQADAHRLVHRVKAVLAAECVPVFTSDGLQQYFYALTAHFGVWVDEEGKRKPVWPVLPSLLYGQFRKLKVGRKLRHVYTKMLCGAREELEAVRQGVGLTGKIQTAFIERLNLPLRHLVAALSRPGWALAHNREGLRWRMALAAGYSNFCRTHHSLRGPLGDGRYRGRTPLMALGVTNHCWSVHEFITHPVY